MRRTVRIVTTTDDGGGKSAECPFCRVKTRFTLAYDGLVCEYRSKCPHIYKVSIDCGVHVHFNNDTTST